MRGVRRHVDRLRGGGDRLVGAAVREGLLLALGLRQPAAAALGAEDAVEVAARLGRRVEDVVAVAVARRAAAPLDRRERAAVAPLKI